MENYNELNEQVLDLLRRNQKIWLNTDELEAEYGICKSTQAKMRMKRLLPHSKLGRYIRYNRHDIEQMFQDAKVV